MTTGQQSAPHGPAVVRPREHVENVRRDALRAAARSATRAGANPSSLITNAISWALGEEERAPFTANQTPGGANLGEIEAEIDACRVFLESTAWSEQIADSIRRAGHIRKVLEWLTGVSDRPPTYCRETEAGDLVGGRGRVVRPDADIRRMIARARAKLAADQTSYALGADWHQGVIATLGWTLGERATSPVLGLDRGGLPDGGHIAIEQGEAEDHLAAPMRRPDVPLHFADATACTCRWLLGGTIQPPVSDGD